MLLSGLTLVRRKSETWNLLKSASIDLCSASYPNLKSVRELAYKRGFGKLDGKRIALTDNALIEEKLGKMFEGSVVYTV